jgi:hypothetical protein
LVSHAGTLVVERIILKFAIAGIALLLGLTAPVAAAPGDDDNVDAASSRYDSPEVVRAPTNAPIANRAVTTTTRRSSRKSATSIIPVPSTR